MNRTSPDFWKEDEGQDIVEYALLLALVSLASAALLVDAGHSIEGIWTATSTLLRRPRPGGNG